MSRAQRDRRGVTLIEVLVALVIVASAASALGSLGGQITHTLPSLARSEEQMRRAGRVLTTYSVLPAAELERRAGRRLDGEFLVEVSVSRPGLYEIVVSRPLVAGPGLRTAVFHPGRVQE